MDENGVAAEWRMPDKMWARIAPLVPRLRKHPKGGRPWIDNRKIADGIFYVLRTGCLWKAVAGEFGSGSSLHRRFQQDRTHRLSRCQCVVGRLDRFQAGYQRTFDRQGVGVGVVLDPFQQWVQRGVFRKLWKAGLLEYDQLKGIQWEWQALDGAMTKAPLGGEKMREKPDGSREKLYQALLAHRRRRRTPRPGGGRGESA